MIFSTIILDFDGTMADTQTLIVQTMQHTLDRLGLPQQPAERCAAMIGRPLRETFTELMPMSLEMGKRCEQTYREIFFQNNKPGAVPLFPHVRETLTQLHQQGITLTIASSRSRETLCGFVNDMQLAPLISLIVGADDISHAKPHPEPVLKILSQLGLKAKDALVVGDTTFDILMGRAANCPTCAVTYGNHTRQQLLTANPDYLIDDFAQLLPLAGINDSHSQNEE
ncbi:MAG: HAD-IA family hydrolase [Prevotella sp.]|nr:HAD-IA family hydrolase [Prevotella sp.]